MKKRKNRFGSLTSDLTANAFGTSKRKKGISVTRYDPSRTLTLRRGMSAKLKRKFALLKGRVRSLVQQHNVFGLTSNFDPNQARDELGRFSESGALAGDVMKSGGFTYKPSTHRTPTKGLVVSLPRERGYERIIPADEFAAKGKHAIHEYLKKVRDDIKAGKLDAKHAHVGAWRDTATNRVVLDVNEVYSDKEEGIRVGKERSQDAVFDLESFTEVNLRDEQGRRPTTRNAAAIVWRRVRRGLGKTSRTTGPRIGWRVLNVFDPDQARDENGRWTGGGVTEGRNDQHVFETSFQEGGHGFNFQAVRRPGKNNWFVAFTRGGISYQMHDRDVSPFAVFKKVGFSLDRFIEKHHPENITFTAAGDEPNRIRLYDRMLSAIGKKYGYQGKSELRFDEGDQLYTLSRLPTTNAPRYDFPSSAENLEAFQEWLHKQFDELLISEDDMDIWDAYIERGYKQGAGRAYDDTKKPVGDQDAKYLQGGRDGFFKLVLGGRESADKVKLLAARSFDELEGVTEDMAVRMSRVLADGLVEGANPRSIAKDLDEAIDIGYVRAERIARTEIIRAHAEGQLSAFEMMGVEEIGVDVEWSTAGDGRVCDECADMEGMVFSVSEAHGLIPLHPDCRCAFIPALSSEEDEDE